MAKIKQLKDGSYKIKGLTYAQLQMLKRATELLDDSFEPMEHEEEFDQLLKLFQQKFIEDDDFLKDHDMDEEEWEEEKLSR